MKNGETLRKFRLALITEALLPTEKEGKLTILPPNKLLNQSLQSIQKMIL